MKKDKVNYCVTVPFEAPEIDSGNGYSYTTLSASTETTIPKKERISGKFDIKDKNAILTTYYQVYIKEVIYSDPATIVFWSDGTKTISKCAGGDIYSPETGLAICILKKLAGSTAVHNIFADWLPTSGNRVSLKNVREKHKK